MKKIVYGISAFLIAAGLCWIFRKKNAVEAAAPPPSVKTVTTQKGALLETWKISGFIQGDENTQVASKVAGRLSEIFVNEGDQVSAGQTIARIDAQEITDQTAGANDTLTNLENTLKATDKFYGEQVAEAEANAKSAKKKHTADSSQVNSKDVVAAEKAADSAKSAQALQDQMILDQISQAETALGVSSVMSGEEDVRAPFSGYVTQKLASVGSVLASGSPILAISNTDQLELETRVPGEVAQKLKIGAPVAVETEDGQTAPGTVFAVSPAASESSQETLVRIRFDSAAAQENLHLGDFVEGQLSLPAPAAGSDVLIPQSALLRYYDNTFVFVEKNGTVEKKAVTVSRFSGTRAEISQGLAPGEAVVTDGKFNLVDGDKITPIPDQS
jgi:RND family efflux transporter MFP subunit